MIFFIKNNLTGGANCPQIGYSQHFGECWHDALSTSLLYSDIISDDIQELFNTNTNIHSIIDRINKSKAYLIPINIDYDIPKQYELFSIIYYNFFLNKI